MNIWLDASLTHLPDSDPLEYTHSFTHSLLDVEPNTRASAYSFSIDYLPVTLSLCLWILTTEAPALTLSIHIK